MCCFYFYLILLKTSKKALSYENPKYKLRNHLNKCSKGRENYAKYQWVSSHHTKPGSDIY